jgi:precorrin-8X/cobalt-precorrin-8 methylmutase
MTITIQNIGPGEIEAESFRVITDELGVHDFDYPTFKVVQRVIHATGDFSFADNMRFHPGAIAAALKALKAGRNIVTDVNMVAAGISKTMLARWGGQVSCKVADPEVVRVAGNTGKTRSEVAIELGLRDNPGIFAIGNAPTALLKIMECLEDIQPENRPVIIGVPVGFVNAAESKALLAEKEYPFITSLGRKGGSPVAAAIVNALIRMAGRSETRD